jgi:phage-related tail protein
MATGAGVIKGVAIPAVNFAALALGYTNKTTLINFYEGKSLPIHLIWNDIRKDLGYPLELDG